MTRRVVLDGVKVFYFPDERISIGELPENMYPGPIERSRGPGSLTGKGGPDHAEQRYLHPGAPCT